MTYTCSCDPNKEIDKEDLIDDDMTERYLHSKRCPNCGNKIDLNAYNVESLTELDIIELDNASDSISEDTDTEDNT